MRKWIAKSFRRRVLFLFISMTLIPCLILGLFVYPYSSWRIKQDFLESSIKYLHQVSQNIDHNIKYMDMISIMSFMDNGVIQTLNDDLRPDAEKTPRKQVIMDEFLFKASELMDAISGVYVFSDSSVYYKSRRDVRVDIDYAYKDDQWYQTAAQKNGTLTIIGAHYPYQMKRANQIVISVARSVIDPQTSRRVGVILIDADMEIIQELAGVENVYDESYLIITDQTGNMIYAPDRTMMTQPLSQLIDQPISSKSGNFFTTIQNESVLANYVVSDYTGWTIIQVIPTRVMYRTTQTLGFAILLFGLSVVILAILISFYFSKRVTEPIVQLSSVVERVGRGHFDETVPDYGQDEIGHLSQGVRDMSARLKGLLQRVTTFRLRQKEAQLEFLQSQINPHFLYNALNAIQMKALINQDEEVADMISALGQFYQMSSFSPSSVVTIQEEIDLVNSYLSVIRIRFGDEFRCTVTVDHEIVHYYCLKLILQPIVENAVFHGVEKKSGSGEIRISAAQESDSVLITVADNGAGMTPDQLRLIRETLNHDDSSEHHTGMIGLRNVNSRIRLHEGSDYGLQVFSEVGVGTTVQIRLPIRKTPVQLDQSDSQA
jgi:two-component system sensor histidine kinase YesM